MNRVRMLTALVLMISLSANLSPSSALRRSRVWRRNTPRSTVATKPTNPAVAVPTATLGRIASSSTVVAFTFGGRARRALVVVPEHGVRDSLPLVLVLHGNGGTGKSMAASSGFGDLAEQKKFAVAFPDGIDKGWNDGRSDAVSTAAIENVDDVGYLVQLVQVISKTAPIDSKRVFAAGMSNGAMMSNRLACEATSSFAAVALVSGTGPFDFANKCQPAASISIIQIHGTADPLIPYLGGVVDASRVGGSGNRGAVISVDDFARVWVRNERCDAAPTMTGQSSPSVSSRSWKCPSAELQFLRVEGGGHSWPGALRTLPTRLVGPTNYEINASGEIWAFFARQVRP